MRLGFVVALAWLASVCFPLLTYTTTLAVFGLAHVIGELRYLQRRFGTWLAPALVPLLGSLSLVVVVRLASWTDVVGRDLGRVLELGVALLVVGALAGWWARTPRSGVGGLVVCALLLGGLLVSPLHTLLAVAVLHNWTPVPLLVEAWPRAQRRTFLGVALVVFGVLPALIATGLPWALLGDLGAVDTRILPSGSLRANLPAYLPPRWIGTSMDQHLFSAIVFAQCLHYTAVIGVMPRLGPRPSRPLLWAAGIVVATAILFVGYAWDFREARTAYGVVAAVHAWVEIPILVLLLLPVSRSSPS